MRLLLGLLCSVTKDPSLAIFIWEDMSLSRTSNLIFRKKTVVLDNVENVLNNFPHERLRNLIKIL
jgi:hypothetical protein